MTSHLSALLPRYAAVYRMLRSLTPLSADCGKLCDSRCCKGDKEHGMLLFPHESELLSRAGYDITWRSMGGRQVEFAVCRGVCRRSLRPLSCRIFPFAPRLDAQGRLLIKPDPRALPFCPLLSTEAKSYLNPAFLKGVEEAFALLLQCREMRGFLRDYTCILEQYDRFFKE